MFLVKYVVARAVFLVLLPVGIYLSTFYVHLALLTKAGPNDDIMTSAFQASLEVSSVRMRHKPGQPYGVMCVSLSLPWGTPHPDLTLSRDVIM